MYEDDWSSVDNESDEYFGWGEMTRDEWSDMYERTCNQVQMPRLSDYC